MNPAPLFLIIVTLPLLLGGCGGKNESTTETKSVEEKVLDVKPEEPAAETKSVEEVPLNPNLKYEIKDDEVTITGCDKKASGTIIIPATIEGKTVTSIGEKGWQQGAFYDCTSLTSIMIPDSVTNIGKYAFSRCTSLTSIAIGDSVTSIGEWAFWGCSGLTSINIPNSVTSIAVSAFSECASLTSITIGKSVSSIGYTAFRECTSLTSITIPDSVTSFGSGAFSKCTSLKSVTFLGDAPKWSGGIGYKATPTIYRKPDAKGWGETFGGRPVKLISEKP